MVLPLAVAAGAGFGISKAFGGSSRGRNVLTGRSNKAQAAITTGLGIEIRAAAGDVTLDIFEGREVLRLGGPEGKVIELIDIQAASQLGASSDILDPLINELPNELQDQLTESGRLTRNTPRVLTPAEKISKARTDLESQFPGLAEARQLVEESSLDFLRPNEDIDRAQEFFGKRLDFDAFSEAGRDDPFVQAELEKLQQSIRDSFTARGLGSAGAAAALEGVEGVRLLENIGQSRRGEALQSLGGLQQIEAQNFGLGIGGVEASLFGLGTQQALGLQDQEFNQQLGLQLLAKTLESISSSNRIGEQGIDNAQLSQLLGSIGTLGGGIVGGVAGGGPGALLGSAIGSSFGSGLGGIF